VITGELQGEGVTELWSDVATTRQHQTNGERRLSIPKPYGVSQFFHDVTVGVISVLALQKHRAE
jgi:hypothetical protein